MKGFFLVGLFLLTLAACAPSTPPPTATTVPTPGPTYVTVGMNNIRDIQFAPFFVAEQKGYFAQEGLKLYYGWAFSPDGVELVGNGRIDFSMATGDRVIEARAKGLPVVYVANLVGDLPVEVISLTSKNITKPQDLVGKRVGLQCLCGPTYAAWLALLHDQKIDAASVTAVNVGLTASTLLPAGTIDAAVVYAFEEPPQLKQSGQEINEIKVWEYSHLVGNGVVTNEKDIQSKPDLVRRMVRAVMKGLADTLANPDAALQASFTFYPILAKPDPQKSTAKFNVLVPLWMRAPLGPTKPEDWQATETTMRDAGIIQQDVDTSKAFTNQFVENPN